MNFLSAESNLTFTHGQVNLGAYVPLDVLGIKIIKPILFIVCSLQQLLILAGDELQLGLQITLSLGLEPVQLFLPLVLARTLDLGYSLLKHLVLLLQVDDLQVQRITLLEGLLHLVCDGLDLGESTGTLVESSRWDLRAEGWALLDVGTRLRRENKRAVASGGKTVGSLRKSSFSLT